MTVEVLIVGGGLTGLSLAARLQATGRDWRLIEARTRLGGRILSRAGTPDGPRFDLGPAWFWPGQPRIAALLGRLGLAAFPQHAAGRMALQEADGSVRRDWAVAMMGDALRIDGGAAALIDGLAATLPAGRIGLGARLRALRLAGGAVLAEIEREGGGEAIRAGRVVLALPPRLAARIALDPAPAAPFRQALARTPTWMAGQAKLVAIYPRPFWRAAGLNGDVVSRLGPLAEIHDASPADLSVGALFGFVGAPPGAREPAALTAAALAQLAAIFGPEAATPAATLLQDWAREPDTAAPEDRTDPLRHPAYGPPPSPGAPWAGRLLAISSEASALSGGLLEGALEAAESAAARLAPAASPTA